MVRVPREAERPVRSPGGRGMPRTAVPGGGQAGQALVLGAVALGLLLVPLCMTVVAIGVTLSARAALERAAEAAALAAAGAETVASVDLVVRFTDYTCVRRPLGEASAACTAIPGSVEVSIGPGQSEDAPPAGFGPVPGWAEAAGCVGTVWPGRAEPGTYRVCTGQGVVGAQLAVPSTGVLQRVAQAWFLANAGWGGQLRSPRLLSVTAGADGVVRVTAEARPALLPRGPFGDVQVTAEAWPGGGSA